MTFAPGNPIIPGEASAAKVFSWLFSLVINDLRELPHHFSQSRPSLPNRAVRETAAQIVYKGV